MTESHSKESAIDGLLNEATVNLGCVGRTMARLVTNQRLSGDDYRRLTAAIFIAADVLREKYSSVLFLELELKEGKLPRRQFSKKFPLSYKMLTFDGKKVKSVIQFTSDKQIQELCAWEANLFVGIADGQANQHPNEYFAESNKLFFN